MKNKSPPQPVTPAQYRAFQDAYDFFNRELFGTSLPHVLITLQRHAKSLGYFAPDRFSGRVVETTAHELAMNPDGFTGNSDEQILSTLVHEMAHVWQQAHGKPSRRGYHNKQWAEKMKEVGLQPSDTGQPGGKETGPKMSDYIIADGPYAKAYARLQARGFKLEWQSLPFGKESRTKRASKTKFTCPDCSQNAWAKRDAVLICGACYEDSEDGEITLMVAEPADDEDAE
jgi:hypothetical protein